MATGSKKVERWLTDDYPAIRTQADEEDAIIFFLDESTAKSEAHRGRTWGLRGQTPTVRVTGARHRLNLISAVSSEGLLRYKTFTGKLDQWAFIRFLKSLLSSVRKPVIIITDGHPAHRAKSVRQFVEKEPRLLGLHLLPSYSPELNPDELAWSYLKQKLGKVAHRSKENFIRLIRKTMKPLQNSPKTVAGFFRQYHTAYACRY
ncbi:IS630 family transposase [Parendozoicomonas sp. Alg238-R29]|uniref:IS630 family transposase n=1 Tax=Parendozoicomonas sp. Alg238-R29 TaxID=2993446 RepID=UPI00248E87D0|nr:IS630 family transposase [Parendozoicomonas sp. Alg238-R29]